jgi:predicted aspartyl protease
MCNEEIKMLYDTGAHISAVNENVFRKISVDQRPSKIEETSNRQFRSAGGQNLQIKGKFWLPVTIGKKTVQHPF